MKSLVNYYIFYYFVDNLPLAQFCKKEMHSTILLSGAGIPVGSTDGQRLAVYCNKHFIFTLLKKPEVDNLSPQLYKNVPNSHFNFYIHMLAY